MSSLNAKKEGLAGQKGVTLPHLISEKGASCISSTPAGALERHLPETEPLNSCLDVLAKGGAAVTVDATRGAAASNVKPLSETGTKGDAAVPDDAWLGAPAICGILLDALQLLRDNEAEVRIAAAGKVTIFCRILSPQVAIQNILPCVKELSSDSLQHVRFALASVIMGMAPVLGKVNSLPDSAGRDLRGFKCGSWFKWKEGKFQCQMCWMDAGCGIIEGEKFLFGPQ